MIYLDHNATTRPSEAVCAEVDRACRELWQNPSSIHRPGQAVRHAVELARAAVASLVNARPREVVLTGGGTESIELAIRGRLATPAFAEAEFRPAVVTTAVEHAAIRDLLDALGDAVEVRHLPLDSSGVVDPDGLNGLLDERVAVVSVQWANNETGAIQPIGALGRVCRERGVPLHVDGTQWVGKMPTDFASGTRDRAAPEHADDDGPWIDLLTCSAHKFHGPKGVGALVVRRGVGLGVVRPGSQELGRRGGTENVPGILGFGAACEEAGVFLNNPSERERLAGLRDRLESAVLAAVPGAKINGPLSPGSRLWNTTNIGFPKLEAEALLLMLSERGVCASAGAACSSGSLEPSPVLLAMGIEPSYAHGSVRLSLSRETTEDELDRAAEIIAECANRLGATLPA
ncbi:MAG: cysteine desulfurase family protein [Planctomycetota bacterium]